MTSNLMSRYVVCVIVLGLAGLCIALNWPINLGIDLKGGSILTYEVQKVASDQEGPTDDVGIAKGEMEETIKVISQRINKEGLKDIVVRQEGEKFVSIYLANFTKAQADQIRERMTQVGQLLFPIEAENGDKGYNGVVFNENSFDQQRNAAIAKGEDYRPRGFAWFPNLPQRGEKESEEAYEARVAEYRALKRDNPEKLTNGRWVYFDPEFWDASEGLEGFTGKSIKDARRSIDPKGGNSVVYRVLEQYQADFGLYTQKHRGREIVMLLNDEVWSAATIQGTLTDNVSITKGGGGYTKTEQDWLLNCLQAGSLKLKPKLISQDEISATLGKTAINRGIIAFAIGLVAVVFMMLFYYKTSGIFAIIALVANFVLIFGVLMLLQASITLPGIAGLVLTVGMAVDANILIFERIREEIAKGKSVVQAAKNGFDRAFVTIFDANLTTFIVAAFLVAYGKGPIKGFGITLMTGIVCTMFSALYLTRTLMGWAIKKGLVSEITYREALKPGLKIDFLAKARSTSFLSIALIAVGIVLFVATGRSKYGLDFNGGTSMRVAFSEALSEKQIKDKISGLGKYEDIEVTLIDAKDGKSGVAKINLDYQPTENAAAEDGEDEYETIQLEIASAFSGQLASETLTAVDYNTAGKKWSARLHLVEPATEEAVLAALTKANFRNPTAVKVASIDPSTVNSTEQWQIDAEVAADSREEIVANLYNGLRDGENLIASSPFREVRFVGPKVVADLKSSALAAMIASLAFILAYIWFRFKEIKYGVAAAAALIHDVLIALGVTIGFNLIGVNVPLSLNVIAAFLTIIGYSLNDTIVVFDRIRENRGNMRGTFADVVNRSVNQTLSRTILTSLTTAVVVAAIFFCNLGIESPLEGFAFCLLVGVIVGTYSSIFFCIKKRTLSRNSVETSLTRNAAKAR